MEQEIVESKEEHVEPKQEVVESKEEHVEAKQEVVESKEEHVEPKQEVVESKEEHVEPKQEVVESKEEHVEAKQEIVETKQEHVVLNKNALMSQLLLDILVKNDDIKGFADKITIKVSNQTLVLLQKILSKAPEALDKVVDNVKDILSDGAIDHKDIPKMIILVSNLYKTDLKSIVSSKTLTTTQIVEFIQFVIKLSIDLEFVSVKDKVQIFDIIEASGAILEMIIPQQEINCGGLMSCFPCLKKKGEQ
jgi:hypothetical protein